MTSVQLKIVNARDGGTVWEWLKSEPTIGFYVENRFYNTSGGLPNVDRYASRYIDVSLSRVDGLYVGIPSIASLLRRESLACLLLLAAACTMVSAALVDWYKTDGP